jgi:WD40 repeat protein
MRRLWDVTTGKHTATLPGHTDFIYSVVFSADGKTLTSGAFDGAIKLWGMPATRKAAKRTQP